MYAIFRYPLNLLFKLLGRHVEHPHLPAEVFPELTKQSTPSPLILATTGAEKSPYAPAVEGALPSDLQGVLYRNGPGIFHRENRRKRFILEGDGLIQRYSLSAEGVKYHSRFVRTKKFTLEENCGEFRCATWGTMAPGGVANNLMPGLNWKTSSGVSVWKKNGKLFAFDEMALPTELDPDSLETIGPYNFAPDQKSLVYSAHPKLDPKTGQWVHFGLKTRKSLAVFITVVDKNGQLQETREVPCPRYVYMHDFFLTERYYIFILHPAFIQIPQFLLGKTSFKGCFQWRGEEGNTVMVVPRDATQPV